MSNFRSFHPVEKPDTSVSLVEVPAAMQVASSPVAVELVKQGELIADVVNPPVLHTQVDLDKVEDASDINSEQTQTSLLETLVPVLKLGGKPAALILALGIFAFLLKDVLLVPIILAIAACIAVVLAMLPKSS